MLFVLALCRAISLIVRLLEKPEGRRQGHVDFLLACHATANFLAVLYYLCALILELLKIYVLCEDLSYVQRKHVATTGSVRPLFALGDRVSQEGVLVG